jgi:hypothetical protein
MAPNIAAARGALAAGQITVGCDGEHKARSEVRGQIAEVKTYEVKAYEAWLFASAI